MSEFEAFLQRQLREDAEFRKEYGRLAPLYEVIEQVVRRRHELNLTQEQLAQRMGRQQPAIARLEGGHVWPSLTFLQELAEALDLKLTVKFEPKEPGQRVPRSKRKNAQPA